LALQQLGDCRTAGVGVIDRPAESTAEMPSCEYKVALVALMLIANWPGAASARPSIDPAVQLLAQLGSREMSAPMAAIRGLADA
jgi:hypothetical protein